MQLADAIKSKSYAVNRPIADYVFFFKFFEHNHTPSGKKMVTRVQVITASQVQTIGCRWQALFFLPIKER